MTIREIDEALIDVDEFTTASIYGEFEGAPFEYASQMVTRDSIYMRTINEYSLREEMKWKPLPPNRLLLLREVLIKSYTSFSPFTQWKEETSIGILKRVLSKRLIKKGAHLQEKAVDGDYNLFLPQVMEEDREFFLNDEEMRELVPYRYIGEADIISSIETPRVPPHWEGERGLSFWNDPQGWMNA